MTTAKKLTLAAIAIAVSLVIMDATIVNVALPVVINDLELTATEAQWMNAVYSLVFAALLLTVGRLGDRYGRRRILVIGLAIFVTASLVAGSAATPIVLIAARLVQGIGASMVMPSALSTLNATFAGRERAIAFAVYGATIGGMAAVGPLVGGWLATDISWRWAFWLNIPVVAIALALSRWVPETRDEHATGLDLPGAVISSIGMALIVFAFIEGSTYGWLRQDSGALSPIPFAFAGGVVAMAIFAWVENRRSRGGLPVLIDLKLFDLPTFRWGAIAAMIVNLGEFGLLFALPLLLQGALGYSALGTGWIVLALAAGTFVSSGLTPHLTQTLGARTVVRIGLGLEAVAVVGLGLLLSLSVPWWLIALPLFTYGFGVGLASTQLTNIVMSQVPVRLSGMASGLQSTLRQTGSALGVAILGSLLVDRLRTGAEQNLTPLIPDGQRGGVVDAIVHSAGAVIPELSGMLGRIPGLDVAAIVRAAENAMLSASRTTILVAGVVLGLGLVATLLLPAHADRPNDGPVEELPAETASTR